jgi:GDP-L-fucose synthase
MELNDRIYVAGHNGMVGSAIVRKLRKDGYKNFILRDSTELNLTDQNAVNHFFETEKPQYVIIAAAKVGGIYANSTYRAEFIYDNLMIESNIIHASFKHKVTKLLFLGSSCIYPKFAKQPISEDSLLDGQLEDSNRPYSIAKIAGIEMCRAYRYQYGCNFISAMPTNMYGPRDNYHELNAHVLPALIRKIHKAKENGDDNVILWGTGSPMREFLHVDDLAEAIIFLLQNYNESDPINVGTGFELTINDLANKISRILNYDGEIIFDSTKPDGTPRKILNSSKINLLGWYSKISLDEGLKSTVIDFLSGEFKSK